MSDIDVILNKLSSREEARLDLGVTKKNVWKSEWERAQADSRTTMQDQKYDNAKELAKPEVRQMQGGVTVETVDNAGKSKPEGMLQVQAQHTGVSPAITTVQAHTVTALNNDTTQLMGASRNLSSLLSVSPVLNQYAIHLLEGAESRFRAQYKLQNISILREQDGLKLVLRDYRLSKDELESIAIRMHSTLSELGIEVEHIVINGERFQ